MVAQQSKQAALEVLVEQQVRLVEQALQVLLVVQAQQVLLVLRVQQGLLGHTYRVKLMLHILTWEQEMEQHHD
jgi:hypothetical protein